MAKNRPEISAGTAPGTADIGDPNRVWVSMAKVCNLGNYESLRVEYGAGRAVQSDESYSEAREGLTAEVLGGLAELLELVKSTVK